MLLDTETRYSMMEKLVLALIMAKKKLRQYFEGHTIIVYTDYPLKQVLNKLDLSGRLSKWAIELETYDIRFLPQKSKKGQVLADFLVEIQSFTPDTLPELLESEAEWMWTMHTDGASNSQGAGINVVLEAPSGLRIEEAIRLEKFATNNKAEYETLIYGLELARDMGIRRLKVRGDSKLMIEQVVEAKRLLEEIHEGACGNHIGGRSLAQKALTARYYWPYMMTEARDYAKKCDKCQRFAPTIHQPAKVLHSTIAPWPFAKWGMEVVGELPRATGGKRYALLATNYFTKWVVAEAYVTVSKTDTIASYGSTSSANLGYYGK
ncbi:uncharacterized protein LOC133825478 [Humulus lupulus]|uniref:uncharacterized protein LOC133825478 n=1 Tax=Humulus lupulus TaxID=3486 RepID=UPI002B40F2FB|nr:uncharacterized protein LOC133825478 [Humulus lupulus]